MSRIYANAAYVTVWLGEEANHSFEIFGLLSLVAKQKSGRLDSRESLRLIDRLTV
jgi:hypothetical protein